MESKKKFFGNKRRSFASGTIGLIEANRIFPSMDKKTLFEGAKRIFFNTKDEEEVHYKKLSEKMLRRCGITRKKYFNDKVTLERKKITQINGKLLKAFTHGKSLMSLNTKTKYDSTLSNL